MTTHDTFTSRVRERMLTAGARAGAEDKAVLVPPAGTSGPRTRIWAAEPLQPDDSILAHTGRTWEDWVDLIDAGPGRQAGHTVIAAWVHGEHRVDGWWAQGVTVGYERITGLRLPGQMPDGTFSVSRTRVLALDRDVFRGFLLDDGARADLLPGLDLMLRSKPAAKALRFALARNGESLGSILFSTDPLPDGRLRLGVTHDRLASFDDGERWKQFWAEWLVAVDDAAAAVRSA